MQIIDVCRLVSISYSSKVKFAVLVCILAEVTSVSRYIEVYTSIEVLIDCSSGSFGK